ncbi:MAG: hypothetical protein LIO85_11265 [Rikenellaceae bacterium]|nr:hypothetical protein [Rikenellaceae bacterium]
MLRKLTLLAGAVLFISAATGQDGTPFPDFPPEDVTTEMDRLQMLHQLGISFPDLPPADRDPNKPSGLKYRDPADPGRGYNDGEGYAPGSPGTYVVSRSDFGLWVNYRDDPELLCPYESIDLLTMFDGTRVESPLQWITRRRPELAEYCFREIWGIVPEEADSLSVDWETEFSSVLSLDGAPEVKYEEWFLRGTIGTALYPRIRNRPEINARMFIPEGADNVPVVIQLSTARFWTHDVYVQECISRGWALVQMDCYGIQPDSGEFLTDYLIGLVNRGNWRKPEDWGALQAWGWGVTRLIDMFEAWNRIDARSVAVTGHSRFGKGALVTMAAEPRLAAAYISNSGALGTSPIRRHFGQDLESVLTRSEYHWLAGNAFKWAGPAEEGGYLPRKIASLPVDTHALLALCAPRPVFIGTGTEDYWADPDGTFLNCVAVSPVYELLGYTGLVCEDGLPVPDKVYMDGDIGFRNHIGGHVDYLEWPWFAEWLERYFD